MGTVERKNSPPTGRNPQQNQNPDQHQRPSATTVWGSEKSCRRESSTSSTTSSGKYGRRQFLPSNIKIQSTKTTDSPPAPLDGALFPAPPDGALPSATRWRPLPSATRWRPSAADADFYLTTKKRQKKTKVWRCLMNQTDRNFGRISGKPKINEFFLPSARLFGVTTATAAQRTNI